MPRWRWIANLENAASFRSSYFSVHLSYWKFLSSFRLSPVSPVVVKIGESFPEHFMFFSNTKPPNILGN